MLAGGDAEGYLRLFRYPCITPRAEFAEAKVYSGTIACARFLYGMRSLVTVGGTDASLMIWELAGRFKKFFLNVLWVKNDLLKRVKLGV